MRKLIVPPGTTFGKLTVVKELPPLIRSDGRKRRIVLCDCKCGVQKSFSLEQIASGHTSSCGCYRSYVTSQRNTSHGMSKTRVYKIWAAMCERCKDKRKNNAGYYHDRGISVCARWIGRSGFVNFLQDMGYPPTSKHEIDRRNNDGNYEPGNCHWVTRLDQMANTRRNVFLSYRGRTQHIAAWCRELNLKQSAVSWRIRNGWTAERAIETPVRNY